MKIGRVKVIGTSALVKGIETSHKIKVETADGCVSEHPVSVAFYLSVKIGDVVDLGVIGK